MSFLNILPCTVGGIQKLKIIFLYIPILFFAMENLYLLNFLSLKINKLFWTYKRILKGAERNLCTFSTFFCFFRYIFTGSKIWRHIWCIIVTASIITASVFVFFSASEFRDSTVMTTIKSTTESLDQVIMTKSFWCDYYAGQP